MTDMNSFLLPLLASAFGGGIVAGAFSIFNRIAANTEEREKWLRAEKTKAYSAFLRSSDMLVVVCTGCWAGKLDHKEAISAFRESQLGDLELLAPPAVLAAATALDDAAAVVFQILINEDEDADFHGSVEHFDSLKREFVSVAQNDLGFAKVIDEVSGSALK